MTKGVADFSLKHYTESIKKAREVSKGMRTQQETINAMGQIVLGVGRDAKVNSPVDTGRLRASIENVVEAAGMVIQGLVGTMVEYGPFQEFGTRHIRARRFLGRAFLSRLEWAKGKLNDAFGRILKVK
jgi:HK97 gp10 family phage protein